MLVPDHRIREENLIIDNETGEKIIVASSGCWGRGFVGGMLRKSQLGALLDGCRQDL
ncbi:hypothetical protein [Ectothiorhodospira haloalkaliphila]|uniref:hypothetical protein n=1 Tax=Ectothiorhodospira haloalkaliphila TaxID=421628 RepID=UPI001EE90DBE|nr:hypothetical protein [Ectothiorhodospira haloalkaliphila]